ncbi:MAG TPA: amino acid permease [Gemmataceae bacterium]|nr:amino acid permease [Gemmataceae bacterium]
MTDPADKEGERALADDVETLHRLGYEQELQRSMGAFSNFAISLSVVCILAGGVTSFHVGLCSVGGASIGLGWPLCCLFSLLVALTMGQVASAFPTAGGLYHWAAILGGRGWGWATAWFNLAGLVTVLAAINFGAYEFVLAALGYRPEQFPLAVPVIVMVLLTGSQAAFNHRGIRVTTRLTDFSGWWILLVSAALVVALLLTARHLDLTRLVSFDNFSGLPPGKDAEVWPRTNNLAVLFLLGLLLPAYTLTGFDASAHTAEETLGAAVNVPRGIVRSVLVSGAFGWVMLAAVVVAAPDLRGAALQGKGAFVWIIGGVLPRPAALALFAAVAVAQYLCGLATVTSASRMAYAFARDGGLPFSGLLRRVSPAHRTPACAVWAVSAFAVLFTVYAEVYETIAAVCAVFLYVSYVLPTALGLLAHGRTWTRMGPWHLGRWYRPLALLSVAGCVVLFGIAVQAPNEKVGWIVGGAVLLLAAFWFGYARRRFRGPPVVLVGREK